MLSPATGEFDEAVSRLLLEFKEGSALELMVFACLTGPKSSLIESFVLLLQSLLNALPEMEQLDVCDPTIRVLTSTLPVDITMHGRTLYSCSASSDVLRDLKERVQCQQGKFSVLHSSKILQVVLVHLTSNPHLLTLNSVTTLTIQSPLICA